MTDDWQHGVDGLEEIVPVFTSGEISEREPVPGRCDPAPTLILPRGILLPSSQSYSHSYQERHPNGVDKALPDSSPVLTRRRLPSHLGTQATYLEARAQHQSEAENVGVHLA